MKGLIVSQRINIAPKNGLVALQTCQWPLDQPQCTATAELFTSIPRSESSKTLSTAGLVMGLHSHAFIPHSTRPRCRSASPDIAVMAMI